MRIALLYPNPDPISPSNWSGTPFGLAAGFADNGVDVVPIGAKLPPLVHEAVAVLSRAGGKRGAVAERTRVRIASRNLVLSRQVARVAPTVDAVVGMGLELYDLASVRTATTPFVTYDDGTLQQMWANADSDIRQSGFPPRDVERWLDQQGRSARASSRCFVSTGWAGRSFVRDYGVAPDRVRVVGMGHRPRSLVSTADRDWSTPHYLFIGVDWKRKNGDAVLRAFSEVRRVYPTATLDVVGKHPAISMAGVRAHGFLPREDARAQALLDSLLASATAFVLPSRFDPSPIAYLEAASAGLPVIATTQGGAGELLGDAALSVHPDDDGALLSAMLRLADPATARSMGASATGFAATASWTHVAGRILEGLPGYARQATPVLEAGAQ
jgi:glycosyltransferase involved in cell wall biosynthesis